MLQKTKVIADAITNLRQISTDASGGMQEMSQSTDGLFAALKGIADAGKNNEKNIDDLEELVNKFKINE